MKVLDHGSVELVETWGSDERIVEAARMSTAKGFLGWGDDSPCHLEKMDAVDLAEFECSRSTRGCQLKHVGDEKLLRYLWEHKHATPFEMAGATFEVAAPIFVFREWHRHRTQSYNELSARYTPMPDVNYVPTVERLMLGGGHLTKQAGAIPGARTLNDGVAGDFIRALETSYALAEDQYQTALRHGVPKELARLVVPVGRYSRMRASANLRNWLAFLSLRMDAAAQWEIRQYANAVHDVLVAKFPRTLALFDEGRA